MSTAREPQGQACARTDLKNSTTGSIRIAFDVQRYRVCWTTFDAEKKNTGPVADQLFPNVRPSESRADCFNFEIVKSDVKSHAMTMTCILSREKERERERRKKGRKEQQQEKEKERERETEREGERERERHKCICE